MPLLIILLGLLISVVYQPEAMTYSPSYIDDASQFQLPDPWDRTFEYAPTPGNFGRSPTVSLRSPSFSQIPDEDALQQVQTNQLRFIPLEVWKKEERYVKQPPICIHYMIEWKVTLNGRSVHKVTERNVVIKPSDFWEKSLKEKVDKVKLRKVFHNRRVRLEEITLTASVLQYRSQPAVHQHSDGTNIDWTVIEEQLLDWGNLIEKGRQLRLDISIGYTADNSVPAPQKGGDKRGTNSRTAQMLSERDARIDAELTSGQPTAWRDVYEKMRCPGSCKNQDWYCWQDPNGKKHYPLQSYHLRRLTKLVEAGQLDLDSHDDVPGEIREQLYAEERKRREKEQKSSKHPSADSGHSININFLSAKSPRPCAVSMPANGSPSAQHPVSEPIDPIIFPSLPLEVAVEEYSNWQKSRVISPIFKDNIAKACDVALANGLDLEQIYKDISPDFFIEHGVILGVSRRFVHDIRKWVEER